LQYNFEYKRDIFVDNKKLNRLNLIIDPDGNEKIAKFGL